MSVGVWDFLLYSWTCCPTAAIGRNNGRCICGDWLIGEHRGVCLLSLSPSYMGGTGGIGNLSAKLSWLQRNFWAVGAISVLLVVFFIPCYLTRNRWIMLVLQRQSFELFGDVGLSYAWRLVVESGRGGLGWQAWGNWAGIHEWCRLGVSLRKAN